MGRDAVLSEEKEKQQNIIYEDQNNELHSFLYSSPHSILTIT